MTKKETNDGVRVSAEYTATGYRGTRVAAEAWRGKHGQCQDTGLVIDQGRKPSRAPPLSARAPLLLVEDAVHLFHGSDLGWVLFDA